MRRENIKGKKKNIRPEFYTCKQRENCMNEIKENPRGLRLAASVRVNFEK
jgi:hypothetical protein